MAVFSVVSKLDRPEVSARIASEFAGGFFQISDRAWFVSAPLTARQLAEKLGTGDEGFTGTLIVATLTGSYWGRANTEFWDWLKAAVEARADGQ